ncbi:MFS transporter [Saccharopolyspora subtropica]|uniref:MFS transporter n=1 Tax=Saccharopolyspora thermophila TaxID=89367 RepID=A0A917JYR0_9PSEU|nr:MFS transporter [Saccharopolyspora subtropica]GGI88659.1 MFS transporter [Saccharopolyspora subtropica]
MDEQLRRARRAGLGSFIGTTIEWYDFYIYSTASALVFGSLFFAESSPAAGVLASFATLWVGFLARPLGGVIFGHLGDRIGRKQTLVVTLVLMGVATAGIGVLPTYATAGVLAPILLVLLRCVQGIAVGGEWGGAVLIGAEHAPKGRSILFGAYAQQGSPAGSILATLAFVSVTQLPDEVFRSWGWRVPFLISAVLVVVGLVIRLRVAESPEFERLRQQRQIVRAPLGEVVRTHPGMLVLGVLASSIGIAATYFITTFILSWSTSEVGMDRSVMLNALLVYSIAQFVTQPFGALAAQRFGLARTVGTLLTINLLTVPVMYALVGTGNAVAAAVGITAVGITGAMNYAVLAGLLAQAFPANVRYTGISLSYQLCSALIGGTAPMVGQGLYTSTHSIVPVAAYHVLLVAVSLVCSLLVIARSRSRAAEPQRLPQRC